MSHDRDAFTEEYAKCLTAAETVDRADINEAYCGALFDEPVREHLHGIRDFIHRKMEENVPMNWFTGEPLTQIEHDCRLAKHCVDLANDVMRGDTKTFSSTTPEELGLSTGQYKRIVWDGVYLGFITMSRFDFHIEDLTVEDVDRVEFEIKSLGDSTFDIKPTFILFGENTVLTFDHVVVQYDQDVPEYEDAKTDQKGNSSST